MFCFDLSHTSQQGNREGEQTTAGAYLHNRTEKDNRKTGSKKENVSQRYTQTKFKWTSCTRKRSFHPFYILSSFSEEVFR
jgi:hypothetical protein